VLETVLELCSTAGYFNISIHDIRREPGVSSGSICHHFRNNESLAAHVMPNDARALEGVDQG